METAPASETAPRVKDPTPRIKVQERDIVQLAFGKCKRCQGTGYMTFVRQMMAKKGSVMYRNAKGEPTRFYERDTKVPIVNPIHNRFGMVNEESGKTNFVRRESDPGERDKEVCACAIARFVRLQATDIDPETNELIGGGKPTFIDVTVARADAPGRSASYTPIDESRRWQ